MDREALYRELTDDERHDCSERVRFAQRQLIGAPNLGNDAWWFEHMVDMISHNSQLLCNVRPYQWDFGKAVQ